MASIRKILSRPDGETALSNAVTYYKNPANRGKALNATSVNRPATIDAYVKPFFYDDSLKLHLKVRAVEAVRNTYTAAMGGRLPLTVPTGGVNAGRIKGAKPARIVIVNSSKTGTYKAAKATQTKYLKYTTETISFPFGRGATANETLQEAFTAITSHASFPAASAESNRKVYLQPEKIASV